MKTAVFSVIYEQARPFLKSFFVSVAGQTDKDFELLLINDGFVDVEKMITGQIDRVRLKEASGSPALLRRLGIGWAFAEGFDAIVFADADDVMGENRVSISKKRLVHHSLIFNELAYLCGDGNQKKDILGSRYPNGTCIGADALLHGNFMGLTNTAVRRSAIDPIYKKIPDHVLAFDWLLFSLALERGNEAMFTSECVTLYRQHALNIAPIAAWTEEAFMTGIRVKAEHYGALRKEGRPYEKLAEEFGQLLKKFSGDPVFRKIYTKTARDKSSAREIWWEAVKTEQELLP